MYSLKNEDKASIMSFDTHLNMITKFSKDNSDFLDYDQWIEALQKHINIIEERLIGAVKRFPATKVSGSGSLEGVTTVYISCPNMVASAIAKLTEEGITTSEDPRQLSEETPLTKKNLLWILSYFDKHLKMIQKHEVYSSDKYDSGLSNKDINLLIKLTVGKQRVFRTDTLSEIEIKKFINLGLRVILKNATGFQRIISILIASVFNWEDKYEFEQINVHFLKGLKGSYKKYKDVYIDESDNCSLDESLFHEITHSFHSMIGLWQPSSLYSNISIMNSTDINLIDQFFPMLRPSVFSSTVEAIKQFIDLNWGENFSKVQKNEKQKLIVLFLEPAFRKIITSGFGNLIYPNYTDDSTQSLKITEATLTSENMALCIYLSLMLNVTKLDPNMDAEGNIIVPTNIEMYKDKGIITHPHFSDLSISPKMIQPNIELTDIFGQDSVWNTTEEQLCMQGNFLCSIKGEKTYVQDKQNEHIYRVRSGKHDASIPTFYRYRFHHQEFRSLIFDDIIELIRRCTPSIKNISCDAPDNPIYDLRQKIDEAFKPSSNEKYSTSGKLTQNQHKLEVDEETFKTWMLVLFSVDYNRTDKATGKTRKIKQIKNKREIWFNIASFDRLVASRVAPLIKKGLKINITDGLGNTPLNAAISRHLFETAKLLVENGADVNFKDAFGNTALHNAVSSRDPYAKNLVDVIIKHKADINAKNGSGSTPLDYAIISNCSERIISKLIESGADVNAADYHGDTPLHKATGNINIMQILLGKKANINAYNHDKETPLWRVIDPPDLSKPKIKNLKFMIKNGANLNARDNMGDTILHCASGKTENNEGIEQLLSIILDNYKNINSLNYRGRTPLAHAVTSNNLNIVKFLVKKHAKIDIKDYDGITCLDIAIREYYNKIAQFLINNIDINSECAKASFHLAARENNLDIVRFFLKKGIDVNAQDLDGNTIMHFLVEKYVKISENAFEFNKEQKLEDILNTLEIIIQNGGNINMINKKYEMPIDLVLKESASSSFGEKMLIFEMELRHIESACSINRSILSKIQEIKRIAKFEDKQNDSNVADITDYINQQFLTTTQEIKEGEQSKNKLINEIVDWIEQHLKEFLKPGFESIAHFLAEKNIKLIMQKASLP